MASILFDRSKQVTQLASPFRLNRQTIFYPAVVLALSVGIHSLVLRAPLPSSDPPESPSSPSASASSETADVSVVILPKPDAPEQNPVSTEISEPALAVPSVMPPPRPAPPPLSAPTPTAPPEAASPETEPPVAEDPLPTELPIEEGALTPEIADPSPPETTGPLVSYGEAFPHAAGAVGGCFGLSDCRRVSDISSYRAVARSLINNLEAQGYQVKLRDDLEDTGRNVYELTLPNSTADGQYLIVFSDIDGSAVYVMSREIMTLQELQSISTRPLASHLWG